MSIAEQLQTATLFKGVSLSDLEALVHLMRRQSFPEGAVLFEKESIGDSVYIILSGHIRIYTQDAEGHELTIRHYGPTQIFGEFSVIDQRPRSASAAAADPLEVLILHRDDFLAFLKERPLMGLAMMRGLAERLRYTTTYLETVIDSVQRLSRGEYDPTVEQIAVSETDAEIQDLIGSFLQMVRALQEREAALKQQLGNPSDQKP
jgi:CRP-like cAMP-binding protein